MDRRPSRRPTRARGLPPQAAAPPPQSSPPPSTQIDRSSARSPPAGSGRGMGNPTSLAPSASRPVDIRDLNWPRPPNSNQSIYWDNQTVTSTDLYGRRTQSQAFEPAQGSPTIPQPSRAPTTPIPTQSPRPPSSSMDPSYFDPRRGHVPQPVSGYNDIFRLSNRVGPLSPGDPPSSPGFYSPDRRAIAYGSTQQRSPTQQEVVSAYRPEDARGRNPSTPSARPDPARTRNPSTPTDRPGPARPRAPSTPSDSRSPVGSPGPSPDRVTVYGSTQGSMGEGAFENMAGYAPEPSSSYNRIFDGRSSPAFDDDSRPGSVAPSSPSLSVPSVTSYPGSSLPPYPFTLLHGSPPSNSGANASVQSSSGSALMPGRYPSGRAQPSIPPSVPPPAPAQPPVLPMHPRIAGLRASGTLSHLGNLPVFDFYDEEDLDPDQEGIPRIMYDRTEDLRYAERRYRHGPPE
ncbi:hypothetical protein CALVIDRAFT_565097 [Calocera viscosa TUFC12733]|uniref:Uncharacterized protein n=1 Tax=Calocera viscosa (strain TUFC12733) TaxID=1330018 RepID=A0A167KT84_CALVF|nr:hypothetical protein CALVIDRAFT_565097 [Calocera viscosa TUFC12733]